MKGETVDTKELRTKLGMTQQEFAVEIGVALRTVAAWEGGESKPSRMALVQLRKLERRVT